MSLSAFSCGPTNGGEMVSRRKILSRSRDDLHMEAPPDEEDVWYQKEKLFKVERKDNPNISLTFSSRCRVVLAIKSSQVVQ